MDLISVIIPVYNVIEYLDQCLESVVNQTYSNLEIILVDDGSTDGSSEKCDAWRERDSRITVIHQENGGISAARNKALSIYSGDYLIFLDSDDYWSPTICRFVHEQMVQMDADMAIFKNLKFIHGEKVEETLGLKNPVFVPFDQKDAYRRMYAVDQDFISLAHNKMFRRSLFREIRFPEGRRYEDAAIAHLLIDKANNIIKTEEALYYYRKRANSIMSNSQANNHCDLQYLDFRRERVAFFEELKDRELLLLCYADYYYELIDLSNRFKQRGESDITDALHREFVDSYQIKKKMLSFGPKRRLKYFMFYYFKICC